MDSLCNLSTETLIVYGLVYVKVLWFVGILPGIPALSVLLLLCWYATWFTGDVTGYVGVLLAK